MSSAHPQSPVVTRGQNPFQLSQSGAEQSTLSGPLAAGASGASGAASTPSPVSGAAAAWAWLLAFAVLGFLLWLVNKTKIGHVILYYLLVLATISTAVMNYRWISSALAPLSNLAGSGAGGQPDNPPPETKG